MAFFKPIDWEQAAATLLNLNKLRLHNDPTDNQLQLMLNVRIQPANAYNEYILQAHIFTLSQGRHQQSLATLLSFFKVPENTPTSSEPSAHSKLRPQPSQPIPYDDELHLFRDYAQNRLMDKARRNIPIEHDPNALVAIQMADVLRLFAQPGRQYNTLKNQRPFVKGIHIMPINATEKAFQKFLSQNPQALKEFLTPQKTQRGGALIGPGFRYVGRRGAEAARYTGRTVATDLAAMGALAYGPYAANYAYQWLYPDQPPPLSTALQPYNPDPLGLNQYDHIAAGHHLQQRIKPGMNPLTDLVMTAALGTGSYLSNKLNSTGILPNNAATNFRNLHNSWFQYRYGTPYQQRQATLDTINTIRNLGNSTLGNTTFWDTIEPSMERLHKQYSIEQWIQYLMGAINMIFAGNSGTYKDMSMAIAQLWGMGIPVSTILSLLPFAATLPVGKYLYNRFSKKEPAKGSDTLTEEFDMKLKNAIESSMAKEWPDIDQNVVNFVYSYLYNLAHKKQSPNLPYNNGVIPYVEMNEIVMPHLLGHSPETYKLLRSVPHLDERLKDWVQMFGLKGYRDSNAVLQMIKPKLNLPPPATAFTQVRQGDKAMLNAQASRAFYHKHQRPMTASEQKEILANPFRNIHNTDLPPISRQILQNPSRQTHALLSLLQSNPEFTKNYLIDRATGTIYPQQNPKNAIKLSQYLHILNNLAAQWHNQNATWMNWRDFSKEFPHKDYSNLHKALLKAAKYDPETLAVQLNFNPQFQRHLIHKLNHPYTSWLRFPGHKLYHEPSQIHELGPQTVLADSIVPVEEQNNPLIPAPPPPLLPEYHGPPIVPMFRPENDKPWWFEKYVSGDSTRHGRELASARPIPGKGITFEAMPDGNAFMTIPHNFTTHKEPLQYNSFQPYSTIYHPNSKPEAFTLTHPNQYQFTHPMTSFRHQKLNNGIGSKNNTIDPTPTPIQQQNNPPPSEKLQKKLEQKLLQLTKKFQQQQHKLRTQTNLQSKQDYFKQQKQLKIKQAKKLQKYQKKYTKKHNKRYEGYKKWLLPHVLQPPKQPKQTHPKSKIHKSLINHHFPIRGGSIQQNIPFYLRHNHPMDILNINEYLSHSFSPRLGYPPQNLTKLRPPSQLAMDKAQLFQTLYNDTINWLEDQTHPVLMAYEKTFNYNQLFLYDNTSQQLQYWQADFNGHLSRPLYSISIHDFLLTLQTGQGPNIHLIANLLCVLPGTEWKSQVHPNLLEAAFAIANQSYHFDSEEGQLVASQVPIFVQKPPFASQ